MFNKITKESANFEAVAKTFETLGGDRFDWDGLAREFNALESGELVTFEFRAGKSSAVKNNLKTTPKTSWCSCAASRTRRPRRSCALRAPPRLPATVRVPKVPPAPTPRARARASNTAAVASRTKPARRKSGGLRHIPVSYCSPGAPPGIRGIPS